MMNLDLKEFPFMPSDFPHLLIQISNVPAMLK